MALNKLQDMSIDPSKLKIKQKEEVTPVASETKGKVTPSIRKEKRSPDKRPSHHRGHGKQDNWVCVTKGEEVLRVERKTVEAKYISQGWNYCSKTLWRQKVRDVGVTPVAPAPKKIKKPKVTEETSET